MNYLPFLLAALLTLTGCGGTSSDAESSSGDPVVEATPTPSTDSAQDTGTTDTADTTDTTDPEIQERRCEIVIEGYGTITLALDESQAPITVENFVTLVEQGFYDGLTFHRIIDGFMIQGGDPLGNGTGNAGNTIKGEFASNGVENTISHTRGTLSMARSQAPDSGSCQFFIVHKDSTFLDKEYAGFGSVIQGMDVVDAICQEVPVVDGNGTVLAENQPVITSITMLD